MHTSFYKGGILPLFVGLFISVNACSQDLSDKDLKTNITDIQNPLKQITSLDPKMFEYNTSRYNHLSLPGGIHYGFIAEDFQQVFPEMVYKKPYSYMHGKNSYRNATVKTINFEDLVPVLIASIKEQQAQINELRQELERLKRK
jgi:hypothetical protein